MTTTFFLSLMLNLDLENSQNRISASGKNFTLWKPRIVALRVERNGTQKYSTLAVVLR
jgi:hypothetical protein